MDRRIRRSSWVCASFVQVAACQPWRTKVFSSQPRCTSIRFQAEWNFESSNLFQWICIFWIPLWICSNEFAFFLHLEVLWILSITSTHRLYLAVLTVCALGLSKFLALSWVLIEFWEVSRQRAAGALRASLQGRSTRAAGAQHAHTWSGFTNSKLGRIPLRRFPEWRPKTLKRRDTRAAGKPPKPEVRSTRAAGARAAYLTRQYLSFRC